MTMISSAKQIIRENMVSCSDGNDVYTFCIHSSCYDVTMISSVIPKIIENMVLM